jgi:hypothetical protein
MGGFAFRLEHQDGTPAEPRTFEAAVPNWGPGDTIHLARERALRVVAVRDDDADQGVGYVIPSGVSDRASGLAFTLVESSSSDSGGGRELLGRIVAVPAVSTCARGCGAADALA